MVNMQTQTTWVEDGFKAAGKGVGVALGSLNEPKRSTAVPSTPTPKLSALQLPDEVVGFLEPALKKISDRFELKLAKTLGLDNEWIHHHIFETPTGKIGFLYLETEVLQDTRFFGSFTTLGFSFKMRGKCKSLFIFSFAEVKEAVYDNAIKVWKSELNFEEADILLKNEVQKLAENDIDIVVVNIQERFGLLESATGSAEKERVNTRRLLKFIDKHFNDDEIRTLCMDLPVAYENLAGDTREGKIRELILDSERNGYFDKFIKNCQEDKKNISWDEVYD